MTERKITAVTTGGKPYFYHFYDAEGKRVASAVWNRRFETWTVEFRGHHVGEYTTLTKARKTLATLKHYPQVFDASPSQWSQEAGVE